MVVIILKSDIIFMIERKYINLERIKNMKYIKIVIKISVFLLLCCFINSVLTFLLINTDSWSRYSIRGLYEVDQNIDILFLGS